MIPQKTVKSFRKGVYLFRFHEKTGKMRPGPHAVRKIFYHVFPGDLKSLFLHPLDDGAISLIPRFLKCFQSFLKMQIIRVDVEAQNMDIFALRCRPWYHGL